MQTETMLQLALITASLQVVIQLLGVLKGFLDWKTARTNANSKQKKDSSRHKRLKSKKRTRVRNIR